MEELALAFEQGRKHRILIIPALFDEGNKLRRFTVEVMRRLDGSGIDCFLPDLPGCNESLQSLAHIEPDDWVLALDAAARHFAATRVLAIRGGGLVIPSGLGGWHYGPVKGASLLRTMLRARVLGAREAGREESVDDLLAAGLVQGLELAGYQLSPEMLRQLHRMAPETHPGIRQIDQSTVGGTPLWLRTEPSDDAIQADGLAATVALGALA